jgi:hypothetical protein
MSENTPPIAEQPPQQAAPEQDQQPIQQVAEGVADGESSEGAAEGSEQTEGEAKPQRTPEQREIERLRRVVDRRTKRAAGLEAQLEQMRQQLPRHEIGDTNQFEGGDSDSLTLSRAEIARMVRSEAERIAPTLRKQEAEIEHRRTVVESLADEWGQERFDALASKLDMAMDGLAVNGKPKAATDAIFEADKPARVIEYLADPDNAAEAEALAGMSAIKAAQFVTRLESRLEAKAKEAKPQRSNAPAPIEPVRGQGNIKSMPDPTNLHAWIKEMNRREAAGEL